MNEHEINRKKNWEDNLKWAKSLPDGKWEDISELIKNDPNKSFVNLEVHLKNDPRISELIQSFRDRNKT